MRLATLTCTSVLFAWLAGASSAGCKPNAKEGIADRGTVLTSAQITRSGAVESEGASARRGGERLGDADVSAAVRREIDHDAALRLAELGVVTTDGVVVITGTADNLFAKERATRRAETTKGVRAVDDRIIVEAPRVDDKSLARDVKNALRANGATEGYDVDVTARKGVVTLTGSPRSREERALVERVAKITRGVAEIDDEIEVALPARRSNADIAREVGARLRWDALVDARLVFTRVDGGKVWLTGAVGSAAEKRRATLAAWVAGVGDVDASGIAVKWSRHEHGRPAEQGAPSADVEVERAIRAAMAYEPRVSAAAVQTTAVGGLVTLRGTAPTLEARSAAEQLAKQTASVLEVDNQILVKPAAPTADAEAQRRVRSLLALNPYTHDGAVAAHVAEGKATLSGTVGSFFEKAEAEAAAAGVRGVRAVENDLEVVKPRTAFVFDPYLYLQAPYVPTIDDGPIRPQKGDHEIRSEIERQLFWSPFVDAAEVRVAVGDGKATLSGKVDTWRERSSAEANAYEGGAVAVDNNLVVR